MPSRLKPNAIGQYFEDGMWTGNFKEFHSSTCAHCQKLTEFPSMRKMMDYVEICRSCMKLICLECYGKGCTPFIKIVDQQEEENQRRINRRRLGL